MPGRRVLAAADVEADTEHVAIQRGPIVYCAEWPDNARGKVLELALQDHTPLSTEFRPDLLNGVTIVRGKGLCIPEGGAENATETAVEFTRIPYYAWAHRGKGQMVVWMQQGIPVLSGNQLNFRKVRCKNEPTKTAYRFHATC